MRGLATWAALLTLLAACSSGIGDPVARSCNGRAVPSCLPFEYTAVRAASVEPSGLRIGDLTVRANVHVEIDGCGSDAPGELIVGVIAIASGRDGLTDAGNVEMRYPLLELRDDGMAGDAVAGGGVIDKSTPNPFDNRTLPPNTDLTLRFEPQRTASCAAGSCTGGTCAGEVLELTYRTGTLAPPPAFDGGVP